MEFTGSSVQGRQTKRRERIMRNIKEFPSEKSRRITKKEISAARKAIEVKTGKIRKIRGRPLKLEKEKYIPISIRLHPKILIWVKKEAKEKGVGYQSIINDILLKKSL